MTGEELSRQEQRAIAQALIRDRFGTKARWMYPSSSLS